MDMDMAMSATDMVMWAMDMVAWATTSMEESSSMGSMANSSKGSMESTSMERSGNELQHSCDFAALSSVWSFNWETLYLIVK